MGRQKEETKTTNCEERGEIIKIIIIIIIIIYI
jgi:hypothetical protein